MLFNFIFLASVSVASAKCGQSGINISSHNEITYKMKNSWQFVMTVFYSNPNENNTHIPLNNSCLVTLIDDQWVLGTSSCFSKVKRINYRHSHSGFV